MQESLPYCLDSLKPHPPSPAILVHYLIIITIPLIIIRYYMTTLDMTGICTHTQKLVTTVQPQLGILSYDTDRPIRIADLPGLVEGAHANVGMGHKFLRHIERTSILLFVIDIGGFQLSPKHPKREAWQTVTLLIEELEAYQVGLSERPALLAVNKMDTDCVQRKFALLMNHLSTTLSKKFSGVVPVSALYRTGLDQLKTSLAELL